MIVLSPNKILKPLDARFWKSPSVTQLKDGFGNENRTVFRLIARVNDGGIVWKGVFEDRDDFDAFLWAIANNTIQYEKELWRLPVPNWSPGLGDYVTYDFATVTFLVSPTGSNQTYSTPSDWNNNSNKIETIGGGASGGINDNGGQATGGGGGAYGYINNLTISGSVTYRIGSGGTSPSASLGNIANGNSGGDTWFNGTTFAGSSVGAKAGVNGVAGTGSAINGGAGGNGASGPSGFGSSGGRGGNISGTINQYVATGGGGAAGPSGVGGNGGDLASAPLLTQSTGGSANNGTTAGGTTGGGNGGNGTEFDATRGCGSGGGGAAGNAGAGGQYGGGGGSGALGSNGTYTGGAGKQGIIVVTYTPALVCFGNSPMLGM